MNIGILGGTFDPIHLGHCRLAWEALEHAQLERVLFVPAFEPPHRPPPIANPEHRKAMVEHAIKDTPEFILDTREYTRVGPSYMVDTLASLRQAYPEDTLSLILGMDAFCGIAAWHEWERLFDFSHLLLCSRPDAPTPTGEAANCLAERLGDLSTLSEAPAGKIALFEPACPLAISSTQIRNLISEQKSAQFLLRSSVYDYIGSEGLYSS